MGKNFINTISGNAKFNNTPTTVNTNDINKVISTKVDNVQLKQNKTEGIDDLSKAKAEIEELKIKLQNERDELQQERNKEYQKQQNNNIYITPEKVNSFEITLNSNSIPLESFQLIATFYSKLSTPEQKFLNTVIGITKNGTIKNTPIKHHLFISNGVKSGEIKPIREFLEKKRVISTVYGRIPGMKSKPVFHFTLHDFSHLILEFNGKHLSSQELQ